MTEFSLGHPDATAQVSLAGYKAEKHVAVGGAVGQFPRYDAASSTKLSWGNLPELDFIADFGGVDDAVIGGGGSYTDNTTLLNDAIEDIYNLGGGTLRLRRANTGVFKTTDLIIHRSGVHLVGPNASFQGVTIYGVHTRDAIIDARGSQGSAISNLLLYGSQATTPRAGIVLGRIATPVESAGFHRFDNVSIDGYFSQSGVYSIASEENLWIHPFIRILGGGAKYCFATDQGDFLSFSAGQPALPAIQVLPLQGSSNQYTTILHPWFNNNSAAADSACIYIGAGAGTFGFTVVGGACLPIAGSYVEIMVGRPDGLDVDGPINFLGMGGEGGAGPTTGFNLLSQGTRILRGLYVQGWRGTFAVGGKFVRQAASLTIRDSEIRAHGNLGVDSVLDETKIFNSRIDRGNGTTVEKLTGNFVATGTGEFSALGIGEPAPAQGALLSQLSTVTDLNLSIVGFRLKNTSNTVNNFVGLHNRNAQDGYNVAVGFVNINHTAGVGALGAWDVATGDGTTGVIRRTRTQLGFMVGTITDPGVGKVNAHNGYQQGGTALAASHLSNGVTGSGAVVLGFGATLSGVVGLGLLDTGAAFDLNLAATGTGVSATRTLTFNTVNGSRTLTIGGNASINQDVSTTGSPTFAALATAGTIIAGGSINTSTGGLIYWFGGSVMQSPADSVIQFTNSAGTTFARLILGTNDASGASLVRSGTTIKHRTGNDGADAGMTALTGAFSGQITSTVTTGTAPLVIASTTQVANLYAARAALADAATLNANLTGPITSTGNATAIASQTGTGTTFVMSAAPAIAGGSHTAMTSLGIRSTGAAFDLTFASAEVLTAGRTLTVNVGDAARTLTFSGNPTIADWFDQGVKTTGTPQFARIGVGQAAPSTAGRSAFRATAEPFAVQLSRSDVNAATGFYLGIDNNSVTAPDLLFSNNAGTTRLRLTDAGAMTITGALTCGNTVNVVSPTAPNRTVTIVIGGTTFYLAAKTTND